MAVTGGPVAMSGPVGTCGAGNSFTVTGTIPGGCTEVYTLTGTFTDANHFDGTFTAQYQPGTQWNAAREFRRRLKIRFDRENIEIPFPQRSVHVHVDDSTPDRHLRAAGAAGG
jgi:hypothetical protein